MEPSRTKNKTCKGRMILTTRTTAIHRTALLCWLVIEQRLAESPYTNSQKARGNHCFKVPRTIMVEHKNYYSVNNIKGICESDPNPSFGRVSHAQQVAPGRHPVTTRKTKPVRIGTWNVRTLLQKGKLDNVDQEMDRMKLNILGLAEVRWKGAGSIKVGSKTLIYSGGDNHERGVGILLHQTTTKV